MQDWYILKIMNRFDLSMQDWKSHVVNFVNGSMEKNYIFTLLHAKTTFGKICHIQLAKWKEQNTALFS